MIELVFGPAIAAALVARNIVVLSRLFGIVRYSEAVAVTLRAYRITHCDSSSRCRARQ